MAKFCSNCGASLERTAKFCTSCGAKVEEPPESLSAPSRGGAAPASESPAPLYDGRAPYPGEYRNPDADNPYAAGGFGERWGQYEPDRGWKEMFLRYDNRLNRKPYIMRELGITVATFVICFVISFVFGLVGVVVDSEGIITMGTGLATIASFAMVVPSTMLGIRRLHDLDKTGWWLLLGFVPLINLAFALYLIFVEGTRGPNRYGPDPLGNVEHW